MHVEPAPSNLPILVFCVCVTVDQHGTSIDAFGVYCKQKSHHTCLFMMLPPVHVAPVFPLLLYLVPMLSTSTLEQEVALQVQREHNQRSVSSNVNRTIKGGQIAASTAQFCSG